VLDFIQVLQRDPEFVDAYQERGQAYVRLDQLDRALRDFNHVTQIKPHDAQSYFNRALVQMSMKQFDDAIRDLDQAILFQPKFAEAFVQRALAYGHMNNSPQADADLKAAEKLGIGSFWPGTQARPDLLQKIAAAREQLSPAWKLEREGLMAPSAGVSVPGG
jgi:tetratricopeptide (TPR) repeat protein